MRSCSLWIWMTTLPLSFQLLLSVSSRLFPALFSAFTLICKLLQHELISWEASTQWLRMSRKELKHKMKKRKRYTNYKQTYIDIKTLVQSCRNTKISIKKITECVITLCLSQKQRWGAYPTICLGNSIMSVPTLSPSTYLWLFVPSWFDQYLCPCRAKSQVPELWQRCVD